MKKLLITSLLIFGCATLAIAQDQPEKFNAMLGLTRQDPQMDWWFQVPSRFGPKLCFISEVTKGDFFMILPIFGPYGASDDGQVDITYDVLIERPDGSVKHESKAIGGYKGEFHGPSLMPAVDYLMFCFDPEDPYGEYTFKITATDHVWDQTVEETQKITQKKI